MNAPGRVSFALAVVLTIGGALWLAARPATAPTAAPAHNPAPQPEASSLVATLHAMTPRATPPRRIAHRPSALQEEKSTVAALVFGPLPETVLDATERDELAGLIAEFSLARKEFEADHAEIRPLDAWRTAIHIPPYPAEGARLRELLCAEIARRFGVGRAANIDAAIADPLDFHCAEFGRTDQTITVTCLAAPMGGVWYQFQIDAVAIEPIENRSQPGTGRLSRSGTTTGTPESFAHSPFAPYLPALTRLTPKG